MCTVSIVPRRGGFRLVCNRDERTTRPPAVPPRWRRLGSAAVLHPLDPQGGGTWVAVTTSGIAVGLLNRHPPSPLGPVTSARDPLPNGHRSRGELPLLLADARDIEEARYRIAPVAPGAYAPFLLLAVAGHQLLCASSDGERVSVGVQRLDAPVAFTSSSCGDAEAEAARLPLFRAFLDQGPDPLVAQRAFHDHRWPDRPALSVRMWRPDARTVSRTRIDVEDGEVALSYEPLGLESW